MGKGFISEARFKEILREEGYGEYHANRLWQSAVKARYPENGSRAETLEQDEANLRRTAQAFSQLLPTLSGIPLDAPAD